MSHRKRPLPSGKYTATIVKAEIIDGVLHIMWVIDAGEYAWRNLRSRYVLDKWGIEKLHDEMKNMGYILYTNYSKPLFIKQFFTNRFRAELQVERSLKNDFIHNVIIEHKIAQTPWEHDVKKERDDSYFYPEVDGERDLPIME